MIEVEPHPSSLPLMDKQHFLRFLPTTNVRNDLLKLSFVDILRILRKIDVDGDDDVDHMTESDRQTESAAGENADSAKLT